MNDSTWCHLTCSFVEVDNRLDSALTGECPRTCIPCESSCFAWWHVNIPRVASMVLHGCHRWCCMIAIDGVAWLPSMAVFMVLRHVAMGKFAWMWMHHSRPLTLLRCGHISPNPEPHPDVILTFPPAMVRHARCTRDAHEMLQPSPNPNSNPTLSPMTGTMPCMMPWACAKICP